MRMISMNLRRRSKNQKKETESSELLVCDECGFRHKDEKGYWGYYGAKFCCPVCLLKHYNKDMEK